MNSRPKRQSAKKCLNALRGASINSSSDTEPATDSGDDSGDQFSDFQTSELESSTSSTSSVTSSSKYSSETGSEPESDILSDDDPTDAALHSKDNRQFASSMVPQVASLLPPYGRVGFTSNEPHKIVTNILQEELNYRTLICKEREHPFAYFPSNISHANLNAYYLRQSMLFDVSGISFIPTPQIPSYLPESTLSPVVTFRSEDKQNHPDGIRRKRVPRYQFDKEDNLLYVGGYVKCIAWSPPNIKERDVSNFFTLSYLAISTLPSIASRLKLSDPASSGPGLIQIWAYHGLTLTKAESQPYMEPHMFIGHDWGMVTAMTWISVPAACVNRENPNCRIPPDMFFRRPHLISGVLENIAGHLIVACSDGFVRVLAVPASDSRTFTFDTVRLVFPTRITESGQPAHAYMYKPSAVLYCAPASKIPPWLGWPVTLSNRSEFPNRLVVGYTSGHLAFYNLSNLNPHFARFSEQLLRPTLLAQVLPGPLISLDVHPLYENIVIGIGLDREVHVWDLSDPLMTESGVTSELNWSTIRTGIGGLVVWQRTGDAIWIGRQEYIFPFGSIKRATESVNELRQPRDVPDRMRSYTGYYPIVSPLDCCRWCFDRGFESVTSLAYSDALGFLAHGEGGGRIQFHTWTTENRGVQRAKTRLDVQPSWTYQWHLRRLHKTKKDRENEKSSTQIIDLENDMGATNLNSDADAEEVKECFLNLTEDVVEDGYGDDELNYLCPLCRSKSPVLCWHKIDKHFQFVFESQWNLRKPKFDFLNSAYLCISALAVSPNPSSATWMAAGTGFGFLQLFCNEHFYHPDMDTVLSNVPSAPLPQSVYTKTRSKRSLRRSTTTIINKPKLPVFGPSRRLGRPRNLGSETEPHLRSRAVAAMKKEEEPDAAEIHSDSTEPCTDDVPPTSDT